MHPLTDAKLEAYRSRLGLPGVPLAEIRERAERLVENAVERALQSGSAALDTLPDPGLEQVARRRWRERVEAGESAGAVRVGSSGTPMGPRTRRAA